MSIELRLRLVPASLLCGLLLACGDDDGGDDGGPSSTTGTIGLTVSPPVSPLDPDGFAVSLNGGADQALPESGELWLEDLPAGSHEVALTDVDEPCVVAGDNPRTITVPAGDTAFVSFNPVCTGAIGVIVSPSESVFDPDGFAVSLNGGADQALPESGELWLEDLPAGSHEVALTDVDETCAVSGDNPRTITVSAGDTAFVNFHPLCGNPGGIVVHTITNGRPRDPAGYVLLVDGVEYATIGDNDEAILATAEPGDHAVTLSGNNLFCTVVGDGLETKNVTVVDGQTAHVDFELFCRLL